MRHRAVVWGITLLALGAVAVGVGHVARSYAGDMRLHAQRVAAGGRMVESACGPIEVAESGPPDGRPLLVIHGSGGGYDQGLTLGADYALRGHRVIAPSRFGYLRTPLPDDPSGQRQADHLACLLDALGVAEAGVLGVSAGGIAALHFAVRHPQRTRALVLKVPAVYRPDPAVPMPGWALAALDIVVGSDFPYWALRRYAPDLARRLVLATPPAVYHAASAAERRRADTVLEQIMPASARHRGIVNDSRLSTGAERVALESIRAPTLVISARDDAYGTYESARYSAAHIPGARFLGFDRGGHALLDHQHEVVGAVDAHVAQAWRGAPPEAR